MSARWMSDLTGLLSVKGGISLVGMRFSTTIKNGSFSIANCIDDIDIHGGEPVLLRGKPVGLTTSGGYGYTVGKSLGWLFVRKGTPKVGLQVQILNKAMTRPF